MKAHKNYQEKLLLYLYEELTEAERAEVEAHLQTCPECREEMQQLQVLHQAIPAKPLMEPDEAALQQLRNAVSFEIRKGSKQKGNLFGSVLSFLQPAPALRVGFAVVIFILGFVIGRQGLAPRTATAETDLQDLLTANRQIQSGNSAIDPLLASVERVQYDPQTGKIEIYYTTVNDIRLQGNMQNAAVKQLLREAILEEQNPTVRLHAVKAVTSIAETQTPLDKDILEALTFLLEKERNPGVRLKALGALATQLPNPYVKSTLLRMLLDDPNPALRIEALEGLLAHELSEEDINIFRSVSKQDPNSFIRTQTEKAIAQYEKAAPESNSPNI